MVMWRRDCEFCQPDHWSIGERAHEYVHGLLSDSELPTFAEDALLLALKLSDDTDLDDLIQAALEYAEKLG